MMMKMNRCLAKKSLTIFMREKKTLFLIILYKEILKKTYIRRIRHVFLMKKND